jgi:dihydroflavonol-4-reductase
VSSIAALGSPKEHETTITEETEWNKEELHSDYAITKYGAEMEVWRGHQEGLEVVIVNPGVIFGFGFPNQGSDTVIQSVKKGQWFYTKGIISIVSVNDVVKSMTVLMNSSISGEKFIVVGENLSIEHFLIFVANTFGIKKPSIYANKTLTAIAWRMDWLLSLLTGNKRKFTKILAQSAHDTTVVSNQKIIEKIGFSFEKKEQYIIPE